MRGFAPCLVVILAGLALGVAGGFAWITGPGYTPDTPRSFPGPALITAPKPSPKYVAVRLSVEGITRATAGALSRGGEAS